MFANGITPCGPRGRFRVASAAWPVVATGSTCWRHCEAAANQEPTRWVPSARHHGLLVPRFLDCEGDEWHTSWASLREMLHDEPPSELLRVGKQPSQELSSLANELVAWSGDDEAMYRGYHLFARRIARDLGFSTEVKASSSAAYDSTTADSDGFISDAALGGFCLYGLVAALFVKALSILAAATFGELVSRIQSTVNTQAAEAVAPDFVLPDNPAMLQEGFRDAVYAALAHAKTALGLVGPHLGLDFIESSSWQVHSSDIRNLVSNLTAVIKAHDVGEAGDGQGASSLLQGSSIDLTSGWRLLPLASSVSLEPPADVHLAIALAIPDHPAILHLSESESKASAILLDRLVGRLFSFDRSPEDNAAVASLSVVGLGDHATATLDAALMVQRAIRATAPGIEVHMALHGLACPAEVAGRHHCRLRCHILGTQCGPTSDALAEWLGAYVLGNEGGHRGSGDMVGAASYAFDGSTASSSLADALAELGASLRAADLLVCSHPVALCFLAFAQLWRTEGQKEEHRHALVPRPMLVHLASTLLYGAPGCSVCVGRLRRYDTDAARDYMKLSRELLTGPLPLFAFTEGAVLSAQLRMQLGVTVASVPALALYLDERSRWFAGGHSTSTEEKRHTVLVTRARLFQHPSGFFLRCLLSEMAISNGPVADAARGHFWFAESLGHAEASRANFGQEGEAAPDSWKSWDEMASCQAAFFIPSDIHQRTFVELYRMHVPLFMPDAEWLLKLPLIAPFGTFAYDGSLEASLPVQTDVPAFFDPEDAEAVQAVNHWYQYSDYARFPHVERCNSIPDLLIKLAQADFTGMASRMRGHYELLTRGATVAFAQATAVLLAS